MADYDGKLGIVKDYRIQQKINYVALTTKPDDWDTEIPGQSGHYFCENYYTNTSGTHVTGHPTFAANNYYTNVLTLHPETKAILTKYDPWEMKIPGEMIIPGGAEPSDWSTNKGKYYYEVQPTSGSSYKISAKCTSSSVWDGSDGNYVRLVVAAGAQGDIQEADTALDTLFLEINEAIDYLEKNAGKVDDVRINGTSILANKIADIKVDGTYNSSSNKVATVSTVTNAINGLDGSATIATKAGDVVTLKTGVTETNGVISNSTGSDITLGTAAVKDYTTDTTLAASGETGKLPTAATVKTYVDNKVTQGAEYLGVVNNTSELYTLDGSAGEGDWVRVGTQFTYNSEVCHVGDILVCSAVKGGNPHATWDVIHTEVDTDTNTQYQAMVGAGSSTSGDVYAASIKLNSKELGGSFAQQDIIKLVNGSNITITPTTSTTSSGKSTGKLTISATDTWRPVSVNGSQIQGSATNTGNLSLNSAGLTKITYDSSKNIYVTLNDDNVISSTATSNTSGFLTENISYN